MHATSSRLFPPRAPRSGFTLIEMLVVMGIIVLLIAIAFPVIGKMIAEGKKTKTKAGMVVIQTALEEYKKDHGGRYPNAQSEGLNSGFAVLARELVGAYGDGYLPGPPPPAVDTNDPPTGVAGKPYMPGDAVSTGPGMTAVSMFDTIKTGKTAAAFTDASVWAQVRANDGADGPGTTITGVPGAKKVTYIRPDAFRVRGCALLDPEDNPILYFVARGNPNINKGINNNANNPSFLAAGAAGCKFDASDNAQFFCRQNDTNITTTRATAVKRIQALAGDFDASAGTAAPSFNGIIDGSETAALNGPYILWAAGPDGFYGPNVTELELTSDPAKIKQAVVKCDDVTLTQ